MTLPMSWRFMTTISSDSIFGLAPKTLRTTRSRRRRGIAAVSGGRSRPALARPR
jgi:hypothetical protein